MTAIELAIKRIESEVEAARDNATQALVNGDGIIVADRFLVFAEARERDLTILREEAARDSRLGETINQAYDEDGT